MKKITYFAMCVLLLFVGLLGLHLAAQSGGTESRATENAPVFSLLDPDVAEPSEKELLEQKIAVRRRIVMQVDVHAQAGSLHGSVSLLAEAYANLAAAEIELYRFTGEQDKLLDALKARVEHLAKKREATINAYENARGTLAEICEAELQLIDALLEQKRVRASSASWGRCPSCPLNLDAPLTFDNGE